MSSKTSNSSISFPTIGPVHGAFHAQILEDVQSDKRIKIEVNFEKSGMATMVVDGNLCI